MTWLICDMDGTVLDSMPILSALGIAIIDLASGMGRENAKLAYQSTVGQPFVEQCRTAIGDLPIVERCGKMYSEIHRLMAPSFQLTSFGFDLMNALPPAIDLALVSSTSHDIIYQIPAIRRIPWRTIEGYDGYLYHKKEQILDVILTFGVNRDDCIYVGDVESDRILAAELGLRFSWPVPSLIPSLRHVEIVR